jgi:hypothetical protein
MLTLVSTCHMLSNIYTPLPVLQPFTHPLPEKVTMTYGVTLAQKLASDFEKGPLMYLLIIQLLVARTYLVKGKYFC